MILSTMQSASPALDPAADEATDNELYSRSLTMRLSMLLLASVAPEQCKRGEQEQEPEPPGGGEQKYWCPLGHGDGVGPSS